MTHSSPTPSDYPPAFPVYTDQDSKDQTLAAQPTKNVYPLVEPPFFEEYATKSQADINALVSVSSDLASRLLAQVQLGVEAMENRLGFQIATTIEIVPRHILSSLQNIEVPYLSLYTEQLQLQPSLEPIIQDFSNDLSTLSQAVCSSFSIGIERFVSPYLQDLNASALGFSTFNIIKQLPPVYSLLPDIGWLTSISDHINTLLTALPDWQSLDFKRLGERIKQRLLAAFRSIGLCFAPSMSEDLMYQIADMFEMKCKHSSITLQVWNYYARRNHARFHLMVERWQDNPEYARRWKTILLPALEAHIRGEYGLSISALAPLVEGISSHVVRKNNLPPPKPPKRGTLGLGATRFVIHRALGTAGDEASLERDTTDVTHWLRVKSIQEYIDFFCADLEFERDYDDLHFADVRLRRHGLLHGIQINAMTALNSLRLFLLLDTMYSLLQTYAEKGGKI